METIYHHVSIRTKDIEKVYQALTTQEGLSGWWTKHTSAKPEEGSIATFRFSPDYEKHMRIDKLVPNKQVIWTCIKGDKEWLDTRLTFDLKQEGDFVILDFRHSGWASQTETFGLCSYHWALYMKSLKDLIETGQGQPHSMN